ncbi:hypothetical protein DP187_21790 [Enterobacter cloacae]|nr:hypothetical protein DP187_21790 [Enterobacter cloacae]
MNGKNMLELKSVTPETPYWREFISLYVEYFQRHWPTTFPDASGEEIESESTLLLRRRLDEGDRGLFLLLLEQQPVGLANVWLKREPKVTLNIAEFYIRDEQQQLGLGTALWHAMLQWGRLHGATQLELETDTHQPANAFWQSLGLRSRRDPLRVYYRGIIPPLRILWIRHGRITSVGDMNYCPPDEEIGLAADSAEYATLIGMRVLRVRNWQPIYTSPQRRARETALALIYQKNPAHPINEDEALCEFFPCELIGMKLTDIPEKYGNNYAERMLRSPLDNIFTDSEKVEAAAERILSFIIDKGNTLLFDSRIIIVSHQNLHNVFVASLFGKSLNQSCLLHLDNLHGSTFIYSPTNGEFDIENLNIPL